VQGYSLRPGQSGEERAVILASRFRRFPLPDLAEAGGSWFPDPAGGCIDPGDTETAVENLKTSLVPSARTDCGSPLLSVEGKDPFKLGFWIT